MSGFFFSLRLKQELMNLYHFYLSMIFRLEQEGREKVVALIREERKSLISWVTIDKRSIIFFPLAQEGS